MTKIFSSIWKLITTLKQTTGNLVFLALLALLIGSLLTGETPSVPDSVALVINPQGNVVEQKTVLDPFQQLTRGDDEVDQETLLKDILDAINLATADDRVKTLVLELSELTGIAPSKLSEIGSALKGFKQSEKKIYTFGSSYNQAQYYLAAHADHVYLDRTRFGAFSAVYFRGFGVYPTYFKEALDALKVKIHVFKVGLYKSAVEPFTRNSMSAEAKSNALTWLTSLWDSYRNDVTSLRNITPEAFDSYINEWDENLKLVEGDFTKLAENGGLIDGNYSEDEFNSEISAIVGKSGSSYSRISMKSYLSVMRPNGLDSNLKADKVAIIVAKGNILDGEQPAGSIGSKTLTGLIRQAKQDKTVKALVLRIDSPGGSATASEKIRDELVSVQESGKPVVISMSSYATSGGYWIAATADRIFALENTITGSIGIFAVLPSFAESVNALGLYSDGVGTTELSSALNPMQPINPVLESVIQQSIEYGYNKFTNLVATGRKLTADQVEAVAQGRVWTGKSALEIGLVDELGGLDAAVAAAADLAEIDDYRTFYIEEPLTPKEMIIRQLMESSASTIARFMPATGNAILSQLTEPIKQVASLNDPDGIYSQCLYCQVY
jgi:protease-4